MFSVKVRLTKPPVEAQRIACRSTVLREPFHASAPESFPVVERLPYTFTVEEEKENGAVRGAAARPAREEREAG